MAGAALLQLCSRNYLPARPQYEQEGGIARESVSGTHRCLRSRPVDVTKRELRIARGPVAYRSSIYAWKSRVRLTCVAPSQLIARSK
jgi:hypothetical protein